MKKLFMFALVAAICGGYSLSAEAHHKKEDDKCTCKKHKNLYHYHDTNWSCSPKNQGVKTDCSSRRSGKDQCWNTPIKSC